MMMMSDERHQRIKSNGIWIHVAEQGSGPLVLLLHGFPETWYSWRHQLSFLASHGYHAVAPDLRGYGDSDSPLTATSYTLFHIVGDLIGLIDHFAQQKVFVVGSDWGAVAGWYLSLFRPDRVAALIALSVPYLPRNPTLKILESIRQALGDGCHAIQFQPPPEPKWLRPWSHEFDLRTSYSGTILANVGLAGEKEPGRAEKAFARYDYLTVLKKLMLMTDKEMIAPPDMEIIDYLKTPWSMPSWITEEELQVYADKFEESGFTGAFNYYRAMDLSWELLAPWQGSKITVPTKFITGDKDVGFESLGRKEYVMGEVFKSVVPSVEVVVLDGHHFIHEEKPLEVSGEILSFLRKHSM